MKIKFTDFFKTVLIFGMIGFPLAAIFSYGREEKNLFIICVIGAFCFFILYQVFFCGFNHIHIENLSTLSDRELNQYRMKLFYMRKSFGSLVRELITGISESSRYDPRIMEELERVETELAHRQFLKEKDL